MRDVMSETLDYARFFNSIPVSRFVVKPGGDDTYTLVAVNIKAEEYFRLSKNELIDKTLRECIGDDIYSSFAAALAFSSRNKDWEIHRTASRIVALLHASDIP